MLWSEQQPCPFSKTKIQALHIRLYPKLKLNSYIWQTSNLLLQCSHNIAKFFISNVITIPRMSSMYRNVLAALIYQKAKPRISNLIS